MSEQLTTTQILEAIKIGISKEISHLKNKRGKEEISPQQIANYQAIILLNLTKYFAANPEKPAQLNKRMRRLLQKLATVDEKTKYQELVNLLSAQEKATLIIALPKILQDLTENETN